MQFSCSPDSFSEKYWSTEALALSRYVEYINVSLYTDICQYMSLVFYIIDKSGWIPDLTENSITKLDLTLV